MQGVDLFRPATVTVRNCRHAHRAEAVRARWRMGASWAWLLDATFDEDRAPDYKDHGPARRGSPLTLAVDTVSRAARPAIAIRRKRARSSYHFARAILGQTR